jgi:hypothetical protein
MMHICISVPLRQGADGTSASAGEAEAGSGDTKRDRIREADRRYRRKLRGDIGQLKVQYNV